MEPVLIVGAGPVSPTLAAEFARYRVPLLLIDRAAEATQTSKTLVQWSRTLELMDRIGCTESLLEQGLRAHRAAFRNGGMMLGQASLDDIASHYN